MAQQTITSPFYPGQRVITIDDLRGDALMQRVADLVDGDVTEYRIKRSINGTETIGVMLSWARFAALQTSVKAYIEPPAYELEDRTDDYVIPNLDMIFDVVRGNAQGTRNQSPASYYRGDVQGSRADVEQYTGIIMGATGLPRPYSVDVGSPILEPANVIVISSAAGGKAYGQLTAVKLALTGDIAWDGDGIRDGDWIAINNGATTERFEFDPANNGIVAGRHKITGEYGLAATGVAANIVAAINGITGVQTGEESADWHVVAVAAGNMVYISNTRTGETGDRVLRQSLALTGGAGINVPSRATGCLRGYKAAISGGMGVTSDGLDFGDYFTLSDGTTVEIFEFLPSGDTPTVAGATGVTGAIYGANAAAIRTRIAVAINLANFGVKATVVGATVRLTGPTGSYANIPITEVIDVTGGTGSLYGQGMTGGNDLITLNLRGMSGGTDSGSVTSIGCCGEFGTVLFNPGDAGETVTVQYQRMLYKAIAIRRTSFPWTVTGGFGSTSAAENRQAVIINSNHWIGLTAAQP